MTPFALALILVAAIAHATWNLLAKGARDSVAFSWLFAAGSAALYLPLALGAIFWLRPEIDGRWPVLIGVSASLHLVYYLLLGQGYRAGDLSLVYPLARGTGPLLATIAAILIFGERPSILALGGAGLVVSGVLLMALPARLKLQEGAGRAAAYAVATGAVIAIYTLWDKRGVSVVPPLLYTWGIDLTRASLLAPLALATSERRRAVAKEWRYNRRAVLVVAILGPAAYILVLTALATSTVSYVAPAREISIVAGALLGARLLREGDAGRRLLGAATIVAGVIALALG